MFAEACSTTSGLPPSAARTSSSAQARSRLRGTKWETVLSPGLYGSSHSSRRPTLKAIS